jgi:6-phosphogluconate dehydrogenase
MQLGVVGLGRMGGNIVRRLVRSGHQCVVFDRNASAIAALAGHNMAGAHDIGQLCQRLKKPRAVWVMLPAGEATEAAVDALGAVLEPGDSIIDGGNAFYKDDIRRAGALKAKGIDYIDCGTSGGVWGLERGYSLMIGGAKDAVERLDPIFSALAPGKGAIAATPGRGDRDPRVERGYMHCGPSGAGRFVKMVHNGIEYGLMQADAEGFNILRGAASDHLPKEQRFHLDLADIAEVWRRGSVISSWLLDLTAMALAEDPGLTRYAGNVEDSGEGHLERAGAP